jgi:hypothetical protein
MLPRLWTLGNLFVVHPQLSDDGFPMDALQLGARSHNYFLNLGMGFSPLTHFLVWLVHIVISFLVKWLFEMYCMRQDCWALKMLRTRFEYGLKFHSSQTTNLVSAPLIVGS